MAIKNNPLQCKLSGFGESTEAEHLFDKTVATSETRSLICQTRTV